MEFCYALWEHEETYTRLCGLYSTEEVAKDARSALAETYRASDWIEDAHFGELHSIYRNVCLKILRTRIFTTPDLLEYNYRIIPS